MSKLLTNEEHTAYLHCVRVGNPDAARWAAQKISDHHEALRATTATRDEGIDELLYDNAELKKRVAVLEKVRAIVSAPFFSTADHKDYARLQEALKQATNPPTEKEFEKLVEN